VEGAQLAKGSVERERSRDFCVNLTARVRAEAAFHMSLKRLACDGRLRGEARNPASAMRPHLNW
jgi:hypothetical protein